jgi:hypothetical protein
LTVADVASPVSVALGKERVQLGPHHTALWPALIVSFRARAPIVNGSSDYRVLVRCGVDEVEGVVTHGVRPGELVHHATPVSRCHKALRIAVLYTYDAHPNVVATNLRGPTLTVGTQTFTVR